MLTVALALVCAGALAQEVEWVDITALNYVATGGKDPSHCLRQFLLFDEASVESHPDIFDRYRTFAGEYSQIMMDEFVPESVKMYDEAIAQTEKMIKEHPEQADGLKAQLNELKAARKESESKAGQEKKTLSVDPVTLLEDLKSVAIGKKAYSAWRDVDGGLYAVTTAPRYGSFSGDTDVPESSWYTWGIIDSQGREVVPMKYERFSDYDRDYDIIFPKTIDKNGKVRMGAMGYDGRVRISFEYDSLGYHLYEAGCVSFWKGGKMGLLTLDGKQLHAFEFSNAECVGTGWVVSKTGSDWGLMDTHGRIVVPLKYKDFWGTEEGEIQMERTDGRIDAYRSDGTFEFVRTFDKPAGF